MINDSLSVLTLVMITVLYRVIRNKFHFNGFVFIFHSIALQLMKRTEIIVKIGKSSKLKVNYQNF